MHIYHSQTDKIVTWKPPLRFEGYTTVTCNRQRCTTCKYINSSQYTYSYTTRKKYLTCTKARQGNCRTSGIVYAISCKKCDGCIYVGITTRDLSTRFMEHRNSVTKMKNTHLPLYDHFISNNHTSEDMLIQIIYKTDKMTKEDIQQDLLEHELLWTKILNTAYPFGCNDSIKGYGNISEEQNYERKRNHPYFTYPCPRKPRSHGIRKRNKRNSQIDVNAVDTAYSTLTDDTVGIRVLYTYLRTLPKQTLRKLMTVAMNNKDKLGHMRLLTVYYVVAASIRNKHTTPDRPSPYRWCVDFPNKGMEFVNLETILKDRTLKRTLPAAPPRDISITFKYSKPSKLTLCNYNKVLRDLTREKLQSQLKETCDCATNTYTYGPLKHVLTGNLEIIQNQQLKKIFANGSKYRPAMPINWNDNDKAIEDSLKTLIKWLSRQTRYAERHFQPFYNRFMFLYNSRKSNMIRREEIFDYDKIDKIALAKLHERYVITVVDKAPNNLVIMCKKLFLITLCKELGINHETWQVAGNDVYTPIYRDVQLILDPQIKYAKKCNIAVNIEKLTLASIYPIPKLHKNPYKFRFIASSRKSAMKPVSELLDLILGFIKIHFRNINRKIAQRTGINPWWSIDSTYDFLDICNRIQTRNINNKHLFTGDFSDMFTSCKHETMRKNLCSVIEICFRNSCCTYLKLYNGKLTYTNDSTNKQLFRKEDIYELIDFILDNNYVSYAGFTFKQIKGVPMGLPSAPKMIDLTMAYCEYRYMSNSTNATFARAIGNYTCRYVDDFFSCTNIDIQDILTDIYPTELTLNKTSLPNNTNFLDTTIQLANNKLLLSVYNKTDDFPFPVIKYNHPKSNVHSSTGYNTLYGEVLRFARICNTYESFLKRCRLLFHDFMKMNYEEHRIIITLFKFAKLNANLIVKFNLVDHIDILRFVSTLRE